MIPRHYKNVKQYYFKTSFQTIQNGNDQCNNRQQMLERSEEKDPLIHSWWNCKVVLSLWKSVWKVLKKLKIYHIAHFLAYVQRTKHSYCTDICSAMFTAAPFIKPRKMKQPKCSTTDVLIMKMWYIYTMEYYAAVKKNKIKKVADKWMELEKIILRKESRPKKTNIVCVLLLEVPTSESSGVST